MAMWRSLRDVAVERRVRVAICVCVVLAVALVYAQVRTFAFLSMDDRTYVLNPDVAGGLKLDRVLVLFTSYSHGNWMPLTWLSHMVDHELFGADPGAHHLVNVFYHAVNTLLLFGLLVRLTGRTWPSAAVAGLWALHPLRVESVAWVVERKDTLSGMFALLCVWSYARYAEKRSGARYGVALTLHGLGLLCKGMMVSLPVLLLLVDFWPLGRISLDGDLGLAGRAPLRARARRVLTRAGWLLLEKTPFFALSFASVAMTSVAAKNAGVLFADSLVTFPERAAHTVCAYIRYLKLVVWPQGLSMYYPHPYLPPTGGVPPTALEIGGATLLLAVLTVFAVLQARKRPYLVVGWLWFVISIFPVMGFVNTAGRHGMADRFTYVPMIGLVWAVVWSIADALSTWQRHRSMVWRVLTVALLALLGSASWVQARFWKNTRAVYERVLALNPRNTQVQFLLGEELRAEGRHDEAIRHYRAAANLTPTWIGLRATLSDELLRQGRTSEAIVEYRWILSVSRGSDAIRMNLANALADTGQRAEARGLYEQFLERHADSAPAHFNLAMLLLQEDRVEDSAGHAQEAARLAPEWAPAHVALGNVRVRQGRTDEAVVEFRKALELDPNHRIARENLAAALRLRAQ